MATRKVHPATEALAHNVRVLRARRNNMSQVTLAADADITTNTISDIENRIGNPTLDVLQRIADAFDVEVAGLFAKPE